MNERLFNKKREINTHNNKKIKRIKEVSSVLVDEEQFIYI